VIGTLQTTPALDRRDLLAAPVLAAIEELPWAAEVAVAEIDPDLADTAAFCAAYDAPLETSANCVVVGGRRGGEPRAAACLVLATTRADVNGVVRRLLDVRKASFLAVDDAVTQTGMEFGGITPFGLPAQWPILVDARVATLPLTVVGSGLRTSKLLVPGARLTELPGARIVTDLAVDAA